jgi:predicted ATPase/transcriptional regulator with XRE-family HTH domain
MSEHTERIMVKKAAQATPNRLLRAARKEHGWTQQQVADRIGAPLSLNVSRWENGTAFPSAYYLERLCQLFGKSVRELGLSQLEDETLGEQAPPQAAPLEQRRSWTTPRAEQEETMTNNSLASTPTYKAQDRYRADLMTFRDDTPLLGREQDVAAAGQLLLRQEVRLLTLTGVGGTGKTRLGMQLAAELGDHFADGVCFVALAPIRDPALVAPTMVQFLGLKNLGDEQPLTRLQTYLRDKHLLLVLDNFEHVVSAASLLAELLLTCPRLKLLVTSRELLHLRAEHQFPVPPLALPNLSDLPDLESLSHYAAVELFVQRAQAIVPDFQLAQENASMIAEICVRLDGLPLALELAAARVNLLPPPALLARLEKRLQVLVGKMRDVPERQQTLRKTLAWSYDLLAPEEQRLFRRLSIFVGGWSLEAAEAVCKIGNDKEMEIMDGMTSLLEKSLVQQGMVMGGGEPRLMMLETVREYGLECLTSSGEAEAAQRAHAGYFLTLAEKAERELHGTQQTEWMQRLEREHDNLREVLHWSLELEEREIALRLGGALWWFWNIRGHLSEGRRFLEHALRGSERVVGTVRAKALSTAGGLAYVQGDFDRAERLCRQGLVLFQELRDTHYIADTLWMLGQIAWARGNYAEARRLAEEGRTMLKEVGDRQVIIYVLILLGRVALFEGEYTKARSQLEEALALAREVHDTFHVANALGHLAKVYFFSQGDAATARSLYEEAFRLYAVVGAPWLSAYIQYELSHVILSQGDVALARSLVEESLVSLREVGDQRDLARALFFSANITAFQGNLVAACAQYEESLKRLMQVGDKQYIAFCLERLGQIATKQGVHAWAARLWGAASLLREAMDSPLPPVEHPAYEQAVADVRTHLDEKAFAAAWAEGRMMTLDQVLTVGEPAVIPTPGIEDRHQFHEH